MKLTEKKKKTRKLSQKSKQQVSNRKRKGKERSGNRAHKAHVSEYQLLAVEEKNKGKDTGISCRGIATFENNSNLLFNPTLF